MTGLGRLLPAAVLFPLSTYSVEILLNRTVF